MTEKPVLHYAPRTRSGTTLWMDEELGGVCDLRLVDLKKGEQKTDAYLAINPMGKVPALTIGDHVVTEAAAICAFLADHFSDKGLAPPIGDPARGPYFRWMFFAPSCIEPAMLDKFTGATRDNPGTIGHGRVEDVLAAIEGALTRSPYLLGDQFTAADVVFGATLNFATMFGAFEKTGAIARYLDEITARPSFVAMQEKEAAMAAELGYE